MKRKSFSLKALVGTITIVAVALALAPVVHRSYCERKLVQHVESGDICAFADLYVYGKRKRFAPQWIDPAIHLAAESGDYSTLCFFADLDDIDHRIADDWTALMYASANGHFCLVKELLKRNAGTGMLDSHGRSVIDIARREGHHEIARLLVLSQSDLWQQIVDTEALAHQLQSDRIGTPAVLPDLLRSPKYSELNSRIADEHLTPKVRMWFQACDTINIGIYERGGFAWMVNGKLIDDVW